MTQRLENPVWDSLRTHHAPLALHSGGIARYPRNLAPFAGLSLHEAAGPADAALSALLAPGEQVYFVGALPVELGAPFKVQVLAPLPQLLSTGPIALVPPGPEILALTEAHRADMIALTTLVYPGFFRARTGDLGHYIGIYRDGVLAAMAGERLHCHEFQEMSAICTHPNYLGRGYAARLLAILVNRVFERGETPFLHVNAQNVRARALYERMGFRERARLPFVSVTRRA